MLMSEGIGVDGLDSLVVIEDESTVVAEGCDCGGIGVGIGGVQGGRVVSIREGMV